MKKTTKEECMRTFYHVTRKANLDSIKKHGLLPNSLAGKYNYPSLSKPDSIYLSTTPESATDFVQDFQDGYVLLAIKESALKETKLIKDENFEEFEEFDGARNTCFRVENITITEFQVLDVDIESRR